MKRFLSSIALIALILGTVSVSACATEYPFADVPEDAWYANAVDYVYSKNLMNGIATEQFAPDLTTTRKMVVDVLWRAEDCPDFEDHSVFDCQFIDENSDSVGWAWSNNIVYGFPLPYDPLDPPTGWWLRFEPENAITRQELGAILYRYALYLGLDSTSRSDLDTYADCNSVSSWALEAMQWCVAKGIFVGISSDGKLNLRPQAATKRSEFATVLMRLDRLKNT